MIGLLFKKKPCRRYRSITRDVTHEMNENLKLTCYYYEFHSKVYHRPVYLLKQLFSFLVDKDYFNQFTKLLILISICACSELLRSCYNAQSPISYFLRSNEKIHYQSYYFLKVSFYSRYKDCMSITFIKSVSLKKYFFLVNGTVFDSG